MLARLEARHSARSLRYHARDAAIVPEHVEAAGNPSRPLAAASSSLEVLSGLPTINE